MLSFYLGFTAAGVSVCTMEQPCVEQYTIPDLPDHAVRDEFGLPILPHLLEGTGLHSRKALRNVL